MGFKPAKPDQKPARASAQEWADLIAKPARARLDLVRGADRDKYRRAFYAATGGNYNDWLHYLEETLREATGAE